MSNDSLEKFNEALNKLESEENQASADKLKVDNNHIKALAPIKESVLNLRESLEMPYWFRSIDSKNPRRLKIELENLSNLAISTIEVTVDRKGAYILSRVQRQHPESTLSVDLSPINFRDTIHDNEEELTRALFELIASLKRELDKSLKRKAR